MPNSNIDYDFYLDLSDKDLKKIVSHIKNIQHLRQKEIENTFLLYDWKNFEKFLPNLSKNLLDSFIVKFNDKMRSLQPINQQEFDFYLHFYQYCSQFPCSFDSVHEHFMWHHATVDYLEIIRQQQPQLFEKLKNFSLTFNSPDLIEYYVSHQFIEINSSFVQLTPKNPSLIHYLIDTQNPYLKDIPIEDLIETLDVDGLSKLMDYFQLEKLDLEKILDKDPSYFKDIIKHRSPTILNCFEINHFVIDYLTKRIDSMYSYSNFIPFFSQFFSLVKENSFMPYLQEKIKNDVKNKNAKKIIDVFLLNYDLSQSLDIKEKASQLKI